MASAQACKAEAFVFYLSCDISSQVGLNDVCRKQYAATGVGCKTEAST